MTQWLTKADCKAVMHSLFCAELTAYRGETVPGWQELQEIDSLERLHLAASVNEFFCLHETGLEDRLLMTYSFDDWASFVAEAITETSGLTFRTSGSTGSPSAHFHRWEHIEAEANSLTRRFASLMSMQRVISWLPLHHLYGFMLGVALPCVAGVPRKAVSGVALPSLSSGDVVVTVPPRWDYLARSNTEWPEHVAGVSSTAPLSPETYSRLISQGLMGILDIYGSTETGGVATRWQHDMPYQLLCHWQHHDNQRIKRVDGDVIISLLDKAHWHNDATFTLNGRHDGVVSIGGVNVSLSYVKQRLLSLPSVEECAVRTTGNTAKQRLKAFIVPASGQEPVAAQDIAQLIAKWPAAERPISVSYGDALPTNTLGKLSDW